MYLFKDNSPEGFGECMHPMHVLDVGASSGGESSAGICYKRNLNRVLATPAPTPDLFHGDMLYTYLGNGLCTNSAGKESPQCSTELGAEECKQLCRELGYEKCKGYNIWTTNICQLIVKSTDLPEGWDD